VIVITGATGNTGKVIAERLLARQSSGGQAAGEEVRVIGRSAEKLAPLVALGAEAAPCDVTDAVGLTRAFAGATAVFVLSPPNYKAQSLRAHQEAVSDTMVTALHQCGVKYAVTLSSIGADKSEKTGPVLGLHYLEEKLNRIAGLNVLHLRPAYFMENHMQYIGLIKSMGLTAGTLKSELAIPMIATRDIAAAAADALRARDWTGSVARELLGPRDYAMKEVAAILGASIGKPNLSYSQMPAMMVKPAMLSMGMSADMASNLLEMLDAMNSGRMKPLEIRSPANTTRTTLEQFAADTFAPAFAKK